MLKLLVKVVASEILLLKCTKTISASTEFILKFALDLLKKCDI